MTSKILDKLTFLNLWVNATHFIQQALTVWSYSVEINDRK